AEGGAWKAGPYDRERAWRSAVRGDRRPAGAHSAGPGHESGCGAGPGLFAQDRSRSQLGQGAHQIAGGPSDVVMLDGSFRLIPMEERDLDEVLSLEQRSFSEPWSRKMFLGELQGNAFATNLVLRAGEAGFGEGMRAGALLGYIMFWVVFEELHLMNVTVLPEVRR